MLPYLHCHCWSAGDGGDPHHHSLGQQISFLAVAAVLMPVASSLALEVITLARRLCVGSGC